METISGLTLSASLYIHVNLSYPSVSISSLLIGCIQQNKINGYTEKMKLCQNDYIFLPQRSVFMIHPDIYICTHIIHL